MTRGGFDWGRPPLPLLPRGLRALWARERLPDWVTSELGLSAGVTFTALGSDVWTTTAHDEISRMLRKFLTDRIKFRLVELRDVALLGAFWPSHVDPRGFPWSARVLKCLSQANLLDQPVRLARATAWELRRYRNMGAVSILEFACVAEFVLSDHPGSAAGTASDTVRIPARDHAWAYDVHAGDPRFRPFLTITEGTLGDHLARLRSEVVQLRAALRQVRSTRAQLRTRLDAISRQSLDAAVVDLVRAISGLSDAQVPLLLARLGLGVSAVSRDGAATDGIAAERLRQIEQRFLQQLPRAPLYLPQLDAAIDLLQELAPCPVTKASSALRARALGRGDQNVAMVLTAARLFARPIAVRLDSSGRRLVNVARADARLGQTAVSAGAHR